MKRSTLVVLALLLVLAISGCGGTSGSSGGQTSGGSSSGGEAASTSAPKPEPGTVQVALSWDEPVDVDLEVWDAEGQEAVTSAGIVTEDVTNGESGDEYVDFVKYDSQDLSSGEYVISVYFAEETNTVDSTTVTLFVTSADGDVETRTHELMWEEGKDQWHAFSVDAETGEITDIDELVETVTE